MNEAERFYLERDSRTVLCIGGKTINQIPVVVVLGPEASFSVVGQAAVLSLANQLARVHRHITFILHHRNAPLKIRTLFPGVTLEEAILKITRSIDPYGHFAIDDQIPQGKAITLGIGEALPTELNCYIGATGAIGLLDYTPCVLDASQAATLRGAALASCLGAAAIFRMALNLSVSRRNLSCWNYKEGSDAEIGPPDLPPLDVGNTLVVGVGGVGSAMIYWLYLFGVSGAWVLVDGDVVELNNTNRQIIYIPADAGWPGGPASYKVHVASRFLPNCQAHNRWYHECEQIKDTKFDVILALANEHDVRTRLAQRAPAVMLHATTGANWLSELHRHVLGMDDCIRCRMHDIKTPELGCSTSTLPINSEGKPPDAALPFISAASGLMLSTALQKLHHGDLHRGPQNNWRWYFDSNHNMSSVGQWTCKEGCNVVPPHRLRIILNGNSRWKSIIQ